MMILILGGSGSGKSAYAEDYLLRTAGDKKKYYIATMQIWDEEMQAKVARNHRLRQGKGFTTIEQPTALEQADRKSTRLNSSHPNPSRMPSSA